MPAPGLTVIPRRRRPARDCLPHRAPADSAHRPDCLADPGRRARTGCFQGFAVDYSLSGRNSRSHCFRPDSDGFVAGRLRFPRCRRSPRNPAGCRPGSGSADSEVPRQSSGCVGHPPCPALFPGPHRRRPEPPPVCRHGPVRCPGYNWHAGPVTGQTPGQRYRTGRNDTVRNPAIPGRPAVGRLFPGSSQSAQGLSDPPVARVHPSLWRRRGPGNETPEKPAPGSARCGPAD